MGLVAQMQSDAKQILTDLKGFAVNVTFTTPSSYDPQVTKTCPAVAIKHNTGMNEFGAAISSKTSRITVYESALIDLGYPTRDSNNKLALKDHKINFVDASGLVYYGVIRNNNPDDMIGYIRCDIGDWTI